MKRIFLTISLIAALSISTYAQDARNRTLETIVCDVVAAMPAKNAAEFDANMKDIAVNAPKSVEMLASMLVPAAEGDNNLVEYALAGVARYATTPANAEVKEQVRKGFEAASAACADKYNKQFLEKMLSFFGIYEAPAPVVADRYEAKEIVKLLLKGNRKDRNAALNNSSQYIDEEMVAAVLKKYRKYAPEVQAEVLRWLGENNVKSQAAFVASQVAAEGLVGRAAAKAAAFIGGPEAKAALLKDIVANRNELRYLNEDINAEAIALLSSQDKDVVNAALSIVDDRRAYEAYPEVKKIAAACPEAVKYLKGVVKPENAGDIAEMMEAAKDKAAWEPVFHQALKTLPAEEQFAIANRYMQKSSCKSSYFHTITTTGLDAAVDALAAEYKAGNKDAVPCLLSIDNYKAAPVILGIADSEPEQADNAMVAYSALVQKYEQNSNKKLAAFSKAVEKASKPAVKASIVKRLASVPTMKSFILASRLMNSKETEYASAVAAKDIALKCTEEIDYKTYVNTLTKAADILRATGNADDGYAVDAIKGLLEKAKTDSKPFEPYALTPEEQKEGWEMLFDGTNLDKWVGNKDGYTPVNGVMKVSASFGGEQNLYTAKEYKDFIFRFEFCFLKPGVNNGVGIRTPMGVDAAYYGMCEVQILDHDAPVYASWLKDYQVHGSIYGIVPAKRIKHKALGEWSTMEIKVKGDRVTVKVNGELINDGDVRKATKGHNVKPEGAEKNPYTVDGKDHPGLFNKTGHVGFLGHGEGLLFRNVRILEL